LFIHTNLHPAATAGNKSAKFIAKQYIFTLISISGCADGSRTVTTVRVGGVFNIQKAAVQAHNLVAHGKAYAAALAFELPL
jgi:hypothetical protein